MATASEIFRGISGYEDDEEVDTSDEAIERGLTVIDNIIKHFHSPYPLDDTGRPIPPPPSLTSNVEVGKIRKRKQRKKNKNAKRR